MEEVPSREITRLLQAWGNGDAAALEKLTPLVYNELHGIAHRYMLREGSAQTLQTTALVNEAYLRLVDVTRVSWKDRAHFFAVSSQMMRRIVVDAARARLTGKRGGGALMFQINEDLDATPARASELVALDETLEELAQMDPRKAHVIELRFFGGLNVEETAEVLKVSPQTVLRDWKLAKVWIARELGRRA